MSYLYGASGKLQQSRYGHHICSRCGGFTRSVKVLSPQRPESKSPPSGAGALGWTKGGAPRSGSPPRSPRGHKDDQRDERKWRHKYNSPEEIEANLARGLDNAMSGLDTQFSVPAILPWYTGSDIYRLSTIGNGDCFFHSVLKATSPLYNAEKTVMGRIKIARAWRKELAEEVKNNYAKYDKLLGWSEMGDFAWSKDKLVKHLDSHDWVGDEIMMLVALLINAAIHVPRLFRDGTYENVVTFNDPNPRNIFVLQVYNHYELLARKIVPSNGKSYFSAVFSSDDPVITNVWN